MRFPYTIQPLKCIIKFFLCSLLSLDIASDPDMSLFNHPIKQKAHFGNVLNNNFKQINGAPYFEEKKQSSFCVKKAA